MAAPLRGLAALAAAAAAALVALPELHAALPSAPLHRPALRAGEPDAASALRPAAPGAPAFHTEVCPLCLAGAQARPGALALASARAPLPAGAPSALPAPPETALPGDPARGVARPRAPPLS